MERLTEKDYKGNKLVLKNAVECVSDDLKEWSISTSTTGTQTIRGYAVDKFAEYEDLEEQGKLLKLPCKVGDTLYFPYIDSVTKEKVISKEKVTEIGLYYRVGNGELSSCSEIGNIIFVDESEAESAAENE